MLSLKENSTIPPWLQRKLVKPEDLTQKAREEKQKGLTLATLNGSFDLLHAGHLFIIYEASQQADRLFLLLNTDRSIQSYKGKTRPIISLKYRLEMVAALEFVDFVSFFDESDPRSSLEKIRPDVHVNGEEYGKECIEAHVVQKIGARLHLVRRIPSLSTSEILKKVQACESSVQ